MDFQTVNLMLGKSFLLNCQIFVVTLLLSLPLGLVLSFATMSRLRPVSALAKLYVYLMRSTPLMLQLAIVYYLPGFLYPGHMLPRLTAACLAFVLNYAAYFSEIFRGGIQGVPLGQREAGQVLGMTRSRYSSRSPCCRSSSASSHPWATRSSPSSKTPLWLTSSW